MQNSSPGLVEFKYMKKIWRARWARYKNDENGIFDDFLLKCQNFLRAERAPEISVNSNSLEKIDDFCTKNEFKIFKIRF